MTLWGGAFEEPSDQDLRKLNDSLPFDIRLWREDILGSIAYARALADAGVITDVEAQILISGLEQIAGEFERGEFIIEPGDEDIHTAVERRLTQRVGPVGGKLHTGRSRNDQVATDFRLWLMHTIDVALRPHLNRLRGALLAQAEQHLDTLMPGYTHLQPAQPVTAAHWLMSYFWMFTRDDQRLAVTRENAAVLPLGSGALAGTPLAIDRTALAAALGFTGGPSQNSLDAVSDRDFVADALYTLAMIGVHLSRLAEDLIVFSNPAFGFITLNDRYSTGSSLMPQKRNPDPMELARGKSGRLIGNLTGFLSTLKGLPSSYNKDLQEDKEALLDSMDTLNALLPVITAVIHTLQVNPARMRAALDEAMLATDLADYLVVRGLPFREAHHISGRVVRYAADQQITLSQVPLDVLKGLSPLFDTDVAQVFDFDAAVVRRSRPGGPAPAAVIQQIAEAKRTLL